MKTGIEYASSREKRLFDLTMAAALTPSAFASRVIISHELRKHFGKYVDPIFEQERTGAEGVSFTIRKLRTLEDATSRPYTALIHSMRRFGIDELPQVQNVIDGDMSFVAPRALPVEAELAVLRKADAAIADEWMEVVYPLKRGVISPFSIQNHRTPELLVPFANNKCVSDIDFVRNGSLANDIALVGQALGAAVTGRL